jgi:hypothetical protein
MALSRELCIASSLLENRWIAQIEELESRGKSYGDAEYDDACANLCAVGAEFDVYDE